MNTILSKETLAESLIREGYIDSFVDFFYIASRKTPDIKSKYEKEHNIIIESHQDRQLAHSYDMPYLKGIKNYLVEAENCLRSGSIVKAINFYKELVTYIQYTQDIPGPMYFVQKCINLSKRYDLIKQLIDALIEMGNRFDNTFVPEDLILSMSFKEEAKKLYKHLSERQNLRDDQKDFELEKKIYTSLIDLYKDLSIKAENQNNFDKAIEYLNKQLENLKMLPQMSSQSNEKDKERYYLEQQIEVYLKIANLNYKMRYYDATLECLEILKPLLSNNSDSTSVIILILFSIFKIFTRF
jgi:tRNA nucleotidyltransferase/poly(A) polymerase